MFCGFQPARTRPEDLCHNCGSKNPHVRVLEINNKGHTYLSPCNYLIKDELFTDGGTVRNAFLSGAHVNIHK